MKNYVQSGAKITLAAAAAVSSGDGHLVGSIFGVAQGDADTGEEVTLATSGVFTLPKTSAQAWTQGAKVYWNDSTKVATTAASGNTLIGAATAAAANPSSTGEVWVTGQIV